MSTLLNSLLVVHRHSEHIFALITWPRPKAGGRVLKWAPSFGSTSGLTPIDKFLSSHALVNGGLDCHCRPSLFSLEAMEEPSHVHLCSVD